MGENGNMVSGSALPCESYLKTIYPKHSMPHSLESKQYDEFYGYILDETKKCLDKYYPSCGWTTKTLFSMVIKRTDAEKILDKARSVEDPLQRPVYSERSLDEMKKGLGHLYIKAAHSKSCHGPTFINVADSMIMASKSKHPKGLTLDGVIREWSKPPKFPSSFSSLKGADLFAAKLMVLNGIDLNAVKALFPGLKDK